MRGGRAKSTANRSRWKDQDVLDVIRRSRDSGKETLVKGGIARLSFGSDGPGDDDDLVGLGRRGLAAEWCSHGVCA